MVADPPLKVLVVCLGNICRSPMGEAVLADVAVKRGIDIEVASAGTAGYHVGEEPDERTVATCKKHGVPISHEAQQVSTSDFTKSATAEVRLWGSYLDNKPIPDPYYGGIRGFENVYDQCTRLSNAFLDEVTGNSAKSAL
ncbi:low molecular weight phosphotyrosine protein phosphatase family protein [Pleurotus pulmonarius]